MREDTKAFLAWRRERAVMVMFMLSLNRSLERWQRGEYSKGQKKHL